MYDPIPCKPTQVNLPLVNSVADDDGGWQGALTCPLLTWQVGHLHRVPAGAQLRQPGEPGWGALPARGLRHGGDGVRRAGANGAERRLEVMTFPGALCGGMGDGGDVTQQKPPREQIVSVFLDAFSMLVLPQHEAEGSAWGLWVRCLPCAVLEGTLGNSVISPSLVQQHTRQNLLLQLFPELTFCLELVPDLPSGSEPCLCNERSPREEPVLRMEMRLSYVGAEKQSENTF